MHLYMKAIPPDRECILREHPIATAMNSGSRGDDPGHSDPGGSRPKIPNMRIPGPRLAPATRSSSPKSKSCFRKSTRRRQSSTKRLQRCAPGELLGRPVRILRFRRQRQGAKSTRPRLRPQRHRGAQDHAPELSGDPDFLQRFRREVQVARQVTALPTSAASTTVGYDRQGDRQRRISPLMEFLDGETLEEHLRRAGRAGHSDGASAHRTDGCGPWGAA